MIYGICIYLLISTTYQLMVILEDGKEFCVFKDLLTTDTFKFSYMVSGDETIEKSVNVRILDINNNKRVMYNNLNKITGENLSSDNQELTVNIRTTYSMCFLTKYKSVIVSFEIFTLSESGHIINLAKDESIDEIYRNITEVGYLFEEIEQSLKYFVERREVHSQSKPKINNFYFKYNSNF